MLSRTLISATVMLLISGFAAGSASAQVTNLEAGKSPSQIFSGTCSACHRSPRGLLKTVPASSLPGFLRQHYTTSSGMASVLSSYLVSNGATDTRYQAGSAKQDPGSLGKGKDASRDAGKDARRTEPDQLDRFGRRLRPATATQEARPDADGISPRGEPGRVGRNGKRLARPAEPPDAVKPDGQTPAQIENEPKPGAKQRLGKRGRPGATEPKPDESAKGDTAREDAAKGDSNKVDGVKPDSAKPDGDTAKVDAPKDNGGGSTPSRPDPVPAVTPAPPAAAASSGPTESPPSAPAAAESTTPAQPAPPVTASVPPPVAPAGPPIPPISQ